MLAVYQSLLGDLLGRFTAIGYTATDPLWSLDCSIGNARSFEVVASRAQIRLHALPREACRVTSNAVQHPHNFIKVRKLMVIVDKL